MKRAEYLKLSPAQIRMIDTGEWDDLDEIGLTDEQWGRLTMLLGSYEGDKNASFKDWVFNEME